MAGKYPVVLRASISDAITSGPVNTRPGRRVRSLQRNSIFGVRGRSDEFGGRAGRNHSDRVSPSPQIGVACTVRVHRTVCDPFHGQPILGQLTKVRDLLGRRGPTGARSSKRPRSFDYSLRFREGGWAEVAVGWSGRSSSAAGLTSAALSAGVERRRSASFADSAISSAGPDARGADRVVFGQLLAAGLLLMAYDIPGRDQPFNGSTRREHGTTITDQPFFVTLAANTIEEITPFWERLNDGASIIEPLAASAWSPGFGMLTDRHGVTWGHHRPFRHCDVTQPLRSVGSRRHRVPIQSLARTRP